MFHVRAEAPEAVFDLGGDDGTTAYETEISKWIDLKGADIQAFMDKARKVFMTAGFPPDAVNTTIRSRNTGIARDITNESKQAYSLVVIARKGHGTLPDFMLGSIAAKLAENITHVPLVIVGSNPEPPKSSCSVRSLSTHPQRFGECQPLAFYIHRGDPAMSHHPAPVRSPSVNLHLFLHKN